MPIHKVISPLTGSIWKIELTVGQAVTAGQSAVILESKKAEFSIDAPVTGIVQEIVLSEGDEVYEDDVIFTIEADD